jgi:hypothetical protein
MLNEVAHILDEDGYAVIEIWARRRLPMSALIESEVVPVLWELADGGQPDFGDAGQTVKEEHSITTASPAKEPEPPGRKRYERFGGIGHSSPR